MRLYETPAEERYLSNTLYGLMAKKYHKNSILKSISIDKIENGTAYLTCEPYDDAFDSEKICKLMIRRKNSIMNKLDVKRLVVTYYDDMRVFDPSIYGGKTLIE